MSRAIRIAARPCDAIVPAIYPGIVSHGEFQMTRPKCGQELDLEDKDTSSGSLGSPDGAKRNPGSAEPRLFCPRIPLRFMRATGAAKSRTSWTMGPHFGRSFPTRANPRTSRRPG
jgi:hypothetical protein